MKNKTLAFFLIISFILFNGCSDTLQNSQHPDANTIDLHGYKEVRVFLCYNECFEWVLTEDGKVVANEYYSKVYSDAKLYGGKTIAFPIYNGKSYIDQGDRYVDDRLMPNETYVTQLDEATLQKVETALKDLIDHREDYKVMPEVDFEVPHEECFVMLDEEPLYGQYNKKKDRFLRKFVLEILDNSGAKYLNSGITDYERAAINMNRIGPYEADVRWSDDNKVKTTTIKADSDKDFENYFNAGELFGNGYDASATIICNPKTFARICTISVLSDGKIYQYRDTDRYVIEGKIETIPENIQSEHEDCKTIRKNSKGYCVLESDGDCFYYGYAPAKNNNESMFSKDHKDYFSGFESKETRYVNKKILSEVEDIWTGEYFDSEEQMYYGWFAYVQNDQFVICDKDINKPVTLLRLTEEEIENNPIISVARARDRLYFVRQDGKLYCCGKTDDFQDVVCMNDDSVKGEIPVSDVFCSDSGHVYVKTKSDEVLFWGRGSFKDIYSALKIEDNVKDIKYSEKCLGVIKGGDTLEIIHVSYNSDSEYFDRRESFLRVQKTLYNGVEKLFDIYDYGRKYVIQKHGCLMFDPDIFSEDDCWMDTSNGKPAWLDW